MKRVEERMEIEGWKERAKREAEARERAEEEVRRLRKEREDWY